VPTETTGPDRLGFAPAHRGKFCGRRRHLYSWRRRGKKRRRRSAMGRRDKLIAAVRNNPKDVRFADACRIAVWLGFEYSGGKGSHRAYSRPGEPVALNFQDRKGKIPAYQAEQLIAMIDKYGNEL